MAEIRLTPTGRLCWAASETEAGREGEASRLAALRKTFADDWRAGLFALAAEKIGADGALSLRFWRGIAEHFLTALCHLPEGTESIAVEPPTPAEYAAWVLTAPPMPGGEYLTCEVLADIHRALQEWARASITSDGGLGAFLHERAPQWQRVGRVCFHLAENKNDEHRPFAFLRHPAGARTMLRRSAPRD